MHGLYITRCRHLIVHATRRDRAPPPRLPTTIGRHIVAWDDFDPVAAYQDFRHSPFWWQTDQPPAPAIRLELRRLLLSDQLTSSLGEGLLLPHDLKTISSSMMDQSPPRGRLPPCHLPD